MPYVEVTNPHPKVNSTFNRGPIKFIQATHSFKVLSLALSVVGSHVTAIHKLQVVNFCNSQYFPQHKNRTMKIKYVDSPQKNTCLDVFFALIFDKMHQTMF